MCRPTPAVCLNAFIYIVYNKNGWWWWWLIRSSTLLLGSAGWVRAETANSQYILCVCGRSFTLFHSRGHQRRGQSAWLPVSMATSTVGSEPSKPLLFYRRCLPRPHADTLGFFLICACLLRSIKCCISLPPDSRRLLAPWAVTQRQPLTGHAPHPDNTPQLYFDDLSLPFQ